VPIELLLRAKVKRAAFAFMPHAFVPIEKFSADALLACAAPLVVKASVVRESIHIINQMVVLLNLIPENVNLLWVVALGLGLVAKSHMRALVKEDDLVLGVCAFTNLSKSVNCIISVKR
jgi:hypothetical protein